LNRPAGHGEHTQPGDIRRIGRESHGTDHTPLFECGQEGLLAKQAERIDPVEVLVFPACVGYKMRDRVAIGLSGQADFEGSGFTS